MYTWKTHLSATLRRLARTHAYHALSEIGPLLAGILEARSVDFLDSQGRPLPADTTLAALLAQPFTATVHVVCGPRSALGAAEGDAGSEAAPEPVSRFHAGEPAAAGDQTLDARFERLIRDFDRLEQHHEFMWAGYVVREFLPRCGYLPGEAKLVLDRFRSEGVLVVSKVENPRNPGFPATGVRLNRGHPRVAAILGPTAAAPLPPPGPSPATASDVQADRPS